VVYPSAVLAVQARLRKATPLVSAAAAMAARVPGGSSWARALEPERAVQVCFGSCRAPRTWERVRTRRPSGWRVRGPVGFRAAVVLEQHGKPRVLQDQGLRRAVCRTRHGRSVGYQGLGKVASRS
jgi:hypothetical protein